MGLLVRLQDLEPGLHQAGDALLAHGVFDQGVPARLLEEGKGVRSSQWAASRLAKKASSS